MNTHSRKRHKHVIIPFRQLSADRDENASESNSAGNFSSHVLGRSFLVLRRMPKKIANQVREMFQPKCNFDSTTLSTEFHTNLEQNVILVKQIYFVKRCPLHCDTRRNLGATIHLLSALGEKGQWDHGLKDIGSILLYVTLKVQATDFAASLLFFPTSVTHYRAKKLKDLELISIIPDLYLRTHPESFFMTYPKKARCRFP